MDLYQKKLERNIILLTLLKIVFKRSYLPLIVIYAVSVGVSFEQIGIIAGITGLLTLILEVPSGYLSDKLGHKYALLIATAGVVLAPLSYALIPNFWGVLLGSLLFFGLGTFHSGTFQAFLHETLEALDRKKEYARVSAQIQRRSLIAFMALVTLVPMTYSIDERLPFFIAFVLGVFLFSMLLLLVSPKRVHTQAIDYPRNDFLHMIVTIWKRKEFIFFLFIGFLGTIYHSMTLFRDIYFQVISIPLEYFGAIIALASLAGVGFSYAVVYLEKLTQRTFYLLQVLVVVFFGFTLGFITMPFVGAGMYILYAGFGRIRQIVVHKHLLERCSNKELKATYISLATFVRELFGVFVPIILGYTVGHVGIHLGYTYFTIGACIGLFIMFFLSIRTMRSGAQ